MSDSRTSSPQRTEVPRAKDSLETSKNPIFAGASQETSKNKPTSKISDRQNKNDKNNNDKTSSSPNRQKSKVKSSSQKKDDQATGMVFHSSMALMIRKLMIAAQSSDDGILDVNSLSASQSVSRQRLTEIMNILTDLGVVEKVPSKSSFKWKGYYALMPASSIAESKAQGDRLREEIGDLFREEAILDQWISIMSKRMPDNPTISCSNVVKAIHFPNGFKEPKHDTAGTDEMQKSLVVVSAPPGSLACIPKENEGPDRRLYVGTASGARKHKLMVPDDPTNPFHNKRKRIIHLDGGSALPPSADMLDGKVRVCTLPTKYDESTDTVTTLGTQKVEEGTSFLCPQVESTFGVRDALVVDSTYDSLRASAYRPKFVKLESWDQEIDDDHEGVSDFFVKDSPGY